MITTTARLIRSYDSPSTYVRFVFFHVEETFDFLEGQFVMITATINGKTVKKPYSIATTNQQLQKEKIIGIVVKKTSDHGMSDRLTKKIQHDATVSITGPVGHYTDSKTHPNYLFVSVGSGLSPNVGLFQHLVYEAKNYNTIVNIFGERHYAHIVPHIESLFIDHGQSNVHHLLYLSQENHIPPGWQAGHVQDGLEQAVSILGTQTSCFLCGKPEMVDDVRQKLESYGIAKADITFEKY